MSEEFQMPKVEIGDVVLFATDPGISQGWTVALVESTDERSIEVWAPKCVDNMHRENVRHQHDPIWKNERKRETLLEDNDSGVFIKRAKDQAIEVMLREFKDMKAKLESLSPAAERPVPVVAPVEPKKNKGGRPKKKPDTADYLTPATYDEPPEGVNVVQVEEEEDDERGNATLEEMLTSERT
jgi:hypothetical protein